MVEKGLRGPSGSGGEARDAISRSSLVSQLLVEVWLRETVSGAKRLVCQRLSRPIHTDEGPGGLWEPPK